MSPNPKRISKKKLFAKTVEVVKPLLGMEDWRVTVTYESKDDKTGTVASCQSWTEYKQAKIKLNTKRLKEFNHYEIITIAVHELFHCITWDLAEWAEKLSAKDAVKLNKTKQLDESLVTNLEKIFSKMAGNIVQDHIKTLGYGDLDLTFKDLVIKDIKCKAKPTKKRVI